MTLAQLRSQVDTIKIGGRLPLDNAKMQVYQMMAFDAVTQLCYPLNLTIPYQDRDIYRWIDTIDGVEWFLKKPRIALVDDDFIDIDSRLEPALVYFIAAYLAADDDRVIMDRRAERICIQYACEVLKMGLPKAKEVYEQESFVTGVRFDCIGHVYRVNHSFVNAVISCLLCHSVCLNAAEKKQLDLYKGYLNQEHVRPMDLEALRAIDVAVFMTIMDNISEYKNYTTEQLGAVTTLFCDFETLMLSGTAESWVAELNRRIEIDLRG